MATRSLRTSHLVRIVTTVSRVSAPRRSFCRPSAITAYHIPWLTARLRSTNTVAGQLACRNPSILKNPYLVGVARTCFSSEAGERDWSAVYLEELEDIVDQKKALIIDVREPWELKEFGHFPDAVNIPLGEVHKALQLQERDFEMLYKSKKPSTDDDIVFHCMAGIRSRRALNSAYSLGYQKARHYIGGWVEWAEKALNKPIG